MKAFLISDNVDTRVGMRLAGIEGVVVHEREEILNTLKNAINDREIGIIILTEKIALKIRNEVNSLKLNIRMPLVIEIPDRHGSELGQDRITRYIKESVGIKM